MNSLIIIKRIQLTGAHNLLGNRFYSLRQPAWHGLGFVKEVALSAVEALRLFGNFDITTYPTFYQLPDGEYRPLEHRTIVRLPIAEDNEYRAFGVVKDYQLITPLQVAEQYDVKVAVPLETMGFLGQGERMFLTTKLPSFEVGTGDKVDMYMIIDSPMDGAGALVVRRAPVRVVCQNTLMMSFNQSVEELPIRHTSNVVEQLGDFMQSMYEASLFKVQVFEEAFSLLAEERISDADAQDLTNELYPVNDKPYKFDEMPDSYYQKKLDYWEVLTNRATNRRAGIMQLWNGRVMGGDLPGMTHNNGIGTLWRWYNCATEFENYRRNRGEQSRARDVLFGQRAQTLEKAFDLVYEVVRK